MKKVAILNATVQKADSNIFLAYDQKGSLESEKIPSGQKCLFWKKTSCVNLGKSPEPF